MITVTCECDACGGTGLYSGFMEADGEAVICVRCGGKGCQTAKLREFTGRKRKNGIKKIRAGSGLIIDNPKDAKWISYNDFKKLIPETKGE